MNPDPKQPTHVRWAPTTGEHTDAVLAEPGCTADAIATLRAQQVI